ncbi:transposase [Streptomyces cyaneofuscatus]|uniref:IS110 family transposase n=1 Tax=Streptomyces cyaneofuscatus TaxID=66883 RepID=UPI0037F64284
MVRPGPGCLLAGETTAAHRTLAQQLAAHGENTVVPSTLSARARLLATGGDRKTDPADALHIAQVALFRTDLRQVMAEDQSTILRLLTERHSDLVYERTRITNRLHAVLRDLLPGGAPTRPSAEKAAALMKGIRPLTATDNCRRDIARDLLADLRRLDRQVKENEAQMREALAASRPTLTSLPGLVLQPDFGVCPGQRLERGDFSGVVPGVGRVRPACPAKE